MQFGSVAYVRITTNFLFLGLDAPLQMAAPPDADAGTRLPLCISITAHERLATLEEQVTNIMVFCPEAITVIHINAALAGRIARDPQQRLAMLRLMRRRGVLVNPVNLETKWAHILHAHLSNIRLVRDAGLVVGHFLLMSSGDLLFRPGLEAHVAAFDAGVDQFVMGADWQWADRVMADPVAGQVLESSGLDRLRTSLHEGTFYHAPLAYRILDRLDAMVSDWSYDTTYPKEEVFLPSLVQASGGTRIAPPAAHLMGLSRVRSDRPFLAQVLTLLGIAVPGGGTALDAWADVSRGEADAIGNSFIVSRVPRDADSPLRSLLAGAGTVDGVARSRWMAGRLDALDMLDVDVPGRTSNGLPPSEIVASAVTSTGWLMAGQPVFAPGVVDMVLPPSDPDGTAIDVLHGARLTSRNLRATATRVRLVTLGAALSSAIQILSPAEEPAPAGPEPVLLLRVALGDSRPRAVVLRCAPTNTPPPVNVWLQIMTAAMIPGERILLYRADMRAADRVRGVVWRIPPMAFHDHAEAKDGTTLDVVISLPASAGALALEHLALV